MKNWTHEEIMADLAKQEALIKSGKMKFISHKKMLREMDRQVKQLAKARKLRESKKPGINGGQQLASTRA